MTMTRNTKLTIAAAALTGLLAGTATRAHAAVVPTAPASKAITAAQKVLPTAGQKAVALDDTDKHTCKGQNSCKGKGGCKTGDNGCKGKNSCKGKGGCKSEDEGKFL
jgi:hypothetical protein